MYCVITPKRMRQLEHSFMQETGTRGLTLMQRAAQAIIDTLVDMTDEGAVFLCGPGSNGGDGYAAALLLNMMGRRAHVWALSDPRKLKGDARTNWSRCVSAGIGIERIRAIPGKIPEGCGILVDALFGTGLSAPLEGLYADAARWMNESRLPVLSVDMPSGTPELMVRAKETITFHQRKPVHVLFPGRANCGYVTVADIGIPYDYDQSDFEVLEPEDAVSILPHRAQDTHKGEQGHALLYVGSYGMAGAGALSANAAIRSGAGLVTVACPDEIIPVMQTLAPCATCVQQEQFFDGIERKDAIGTGPGLGAYPYVSTILSRLIDIPCAQVWDADALNWLAMHPTRLTQSHIITPHPGEAARLLNVTTAEVVADPVAAAESLFRQYGAVTLLKGATTVIIGAGRRAFNVTGTPGLATGGSGDVLTGIITALLAQGLTPFDAAQLGALLHGLAGEDAADKKGIRSMNAQDLLDAIYID